MTLEERAAIKAELRVELIQELNIPRTYGR